MQDKKDSLIPRIYCLVELKFLVLAGLKHHRSLGQHLQKSLGESI